MKGHPDARPADDVPPRSSVIGGVDRAADEDQNDQTNRHSQAEQSGTIPSSAAMGSIRRSSRERDRDQSARHADRRDDDTEDGQHSGNEAHLR